MCSPRSLNLMRLNLFPISDYLLGSGSTSFFENVSLLFVVYIEILQHEFGFINAVILLLFRLM